MTTPDPLLPELIAELNAPSRERLIEAVRWFLNNTEFTAEDYIRMAPEHADTIKYCMEIGK